MSIPRGTTPTVKCTFNDETLDLTTALKVYVTFEQGPKSLTKSGSDIVVGAKQVEIYLSQQETLSFNDGPVKVQVNWTTAGGHRASSKPSSIELSEQLLRRVIE